MPPARPPHAATNMTSAIANNPLLNLIRCSSNKIGTGLVFPIPTPPTLWLRSPPSRHDGRILNPSLSINHRQHDSNINDTADEMILKYWVQQLRHCPTCRTTPYLIELVGGRRAEEPKSRSAEEDDRLATGKPSRYLAVRESNQCHRHPRESWSPVVPVSSVRTCASALWQRATMSSASITFSPAARRMSSTCGTTQTSS